LTASNAALAILKSPRDRIVDLATALSIFFLNILLLRDFDQSMLHHQS